MYTVFTRKLQVRSIKRIRSRRVFGAPFQPLSADSSEEMNGKGNNYGNSVCDTLQEETLHLCEGM